MNLEKYAKAGIISGIILVGIVSLAIIPGIINQIENWNRNTSYNIDEDEARNMFIQSPEFQAFAYRFSDYSQVLWTNGGEAQMRLGAYDNSTENTLTLELRYDKREGTVWAEANCDSIHKESGVRYRAVTPTATQYILNTDCISENIRTVYSGGGLDQ